MARRSCRPCARNSPRRRGVLVAARAFKARRPIGVGRAEVVPQRWGLRGKGIKWLAKRDHEHPLEDPPLQMYNLWKRVNVTKRVEMGLPIAICDGRPLTPSDSSPKLRVPEKSAFPDSLGKQSQKGAFKERLKKPFGGAKLSLDPEPALAGIGGHSCQNARLWHTQSALVDRCQQRNR